MNWTKEEEEFLKNNYPVRGKMWCATELNKSEATIRQKTARLNLKILETSEFFKDFQRRAAQSKIGKKRPAHAKFMRELRERKPVKHTQGGLKRIGEASIKRIQTNGIPYSRTYKGWYSVGGSKYFFKSSWEVVYARYLQYLVEIKKIVSWTYEPKTFWFEKIKRGTRSYTPDFFVTNMDGSTEYHEVKGWYDNRSKTKIKRMGLYYPDIKVILVLKNTYKPIEKDSALYPKAIVIKESNDTKKQKSKNPTL